MTASQQDVEAFFDRYAASLLARDETAMARLYAVPSLIVFPGQLLAVTDAGQTEQFFASAWPQYDGVNDIQKHVAVLAQAPGSVWADVTWFSGGKARERFCYQLVTGTGGYQVAVLTPMALDDGQAGPADPAQA